MTREDEQAQQRLHEAIDQALLSTANRGDDDVLTGWLVIYETATLAEEKASAGHFYGPREMTTWRALGLLEWARRFGLTPDPEDE